MIDLVSYFCKKLSILFNVHRDFEGMSISTTDDTCTCNILAGRPYGDCDFSEKEERIRGLDVTLLIDTDPPDNPNKKIIEMNMISFMTMLYVRIQAIYRYISMYLAEQMVQRYYTYPMIFAQQKYKVYQFIVIS